MAEPKIDAASDEVLSSGGLNDRATPASPQAWDSAKAPCPLLDRLPPEMRNRIYEMAFAPEDHPAGTVDLAASSGPPSKALLLTCRQINAEACKLYKKKYQCYWRSSYFFLQPSVEDLHACVDTIGRYRGQDLGHINNLVLSPPNVHKETTFATFYQLVDKRGGWIRKECGRVDDLLSFIQDGDVIRLRSCQGGQLSNLMEDTTQKPTMRQQMEFLLGLRSAR